MPGISCDLDRFPTIDRALHPLGSWGFTVLGVLMLRRVFALLPLCVLMSAAPLMAQNYQSQFSEIKFDSSKGASTIHGDVEVDNASGALSFSLPLGPGIGARGLHYTPTFNFQMAPQVLGSSQTLDWYHPDAALELIVVTPTTVWNVQSNVGGGRMFPGYLDLRLYDLYANRMIPKFELASGASGGISGVAPSASIQPSATAALLTAFGYGRVLPQF